MTTDAIRNWFIRRHPETTPVGTNGKVLVDPSPAFAEELLGLPAGSSDSSPLATASIQRWLRTRWTP